MVSNSAAQRVDQAAEIARLREALDNISSSSQTTNLLWWQVEARAALEATHAPV